MSGFAPAYQNESNDAWLNRVVGDIIASGGNPRDACRTVGQDYDDDTVDAPDSDDEGTFPSEPQRWPRGYQHRQRPSSPHSSSGGQSIFSGFSGPTIHSRTSSLGAHFLVTSPTSPRTVTLNSQISAPRTRTINSALSVPRSPAPPYEADIQRPRPTLKRAPTSRTSKASSVCDCPPLTKTFSTISEASAFSGFAPHPAVRPLNSREVLGEAAGRSEEDASEYPKPLALALIILGICLSVFIISINRNIVATAIPSITVDFHSYNDIGWYGSAYLLTASAFQPLYGRVYMSFNSKKTFLASLAVFETGSLLCGVSPSSTALIVGRSIQGVGSAGILTGSFVIGTHAVPLHQRPVLFAFVGVLFGAGALIGPLLGGVFTDLATWRWCFWVNLPVGAVTLATVFFFFHPKQLSQPRPPWIKRILRLDLVGNVMLLAASVMLFLALELSEQRDSWSSAPVIGLLVGCSCMIIVFICWMIYKGDNALIPPKIVTQRTVTASCLAAFFIYGALLVHAYYLPIWFQAIKGANAVESGRNMIPYMLANALFSLAAGIFVSKNGLFAPPAILGCAIGTIGAGLLTTLQVDTSSAKWIGFQIITSCGLGMAVQQGFSAVQTALPLEQVPIGTAAVVASQSLGGAVFVSVGNTLLQDYLLNANHDRAVPGVDVRLVIKEGATAFRHSVPASALPALLELYNTALRKVFVAATVLVGLAFLSSLLMEFKSIRRDIDAPKGETGGEKRFEKALEKELEA